MIRLLACLLLLSICSHAQKQLVLLKNGKPVGRYAEGEYIYFILKDGSHREGKLVELFEFYALCDYDTVPGLDTLKFTKIHKMLIPKKERHGISPLLGGLLFMGGATYLGIDLINSALGYNTEGVDQGVVKASVTMMAVGGALFFIRPKYRRVNNGTILRTVDYKSKFYKNPYGGP